MKQTIRHGIVFLLIGGILMLGLFGCGKAKYRVDYDGQKDDFPGAKDAYAAGASVKLCFPNIATDTDYSFFLDGERLNTDYEEGKGFVLRFTMPEHDVKLEVRSVNSMTAPEPQEATLRYDSFDGGGPDYRVTVDDPQVVSYTAERIYQNPDHAEMDGAAYTVLLTFRGLRSGSTLVTVAARSPIADNFDEIYRADVDDAQNVTLTLLQSAADGEDAVLQAEPEF